MQDCHERLISAIWLSGLIRQAGIGLKTAEKILTSIGDLSEITKQHPKFFAEMIGGPEEKIAKAMKYTKNPKTLEEIKKSADMPDISDIQVLTVLDPMYPERLAAIASRPPLLYYKGINSQQILMQNHYAAVVGTRNPTPYGKAATEKIVSELSARKVVVVSGMARGIDSLAHRVAIDKNGGTIAVLGNGINIVYPPENQELMADIIKKGMVVSECPPNALPKKSCFPARNRIISGLSDSVAIIEASRKSGTMITAGYAAEQGRDIYAVPGSIFSPASQGTNQLIQDGACVLSYADDMLWRSSLMYPVPDHHKDNFSDDLSMRLYKALRYTESTIDDIAAALEISVDKASEIVSMEELNGRILQVSGRIVLTDSFK